MITTNAVNSGIVATRKTVNQFPPSFFRGPWAMSSISKMISNIITTTPPKGDLLVMSVVNGVMKVVTIPPFQQGLGNESGGFEQGLPQIVRPDM